MLAHDQFVSSLRLALTHLYDPHLLQASPLIEALGLADQPQAASALRRTLVQAIDEMKPAPQVPPQARAWRTYDILFCRYVQQCSQEEVAEQIGISVRHLRREQQMAVDALAHHLQERFHLELMASPLAAGEEDATEEVAIPLPEELAWLRQLLPTQPVEIEQALQAALELIRPLATQHAVAIQAALPRATSAFAVHFVALRQILLGLLTVAVRQAANGRVDIAAEALPQAVEVKIACQTAAATRALSADDLSNLEMVRQLVDACGGRLFVGADAAPFQATVSLPTPEQVPILVIDDHADTIRLFQRYTAGTRYQIVGAPTAADAFRLAEQLAPALILLDVMMPAVDGWELLGRLRQHPLTAHIPIVVCTILPQEELALALGASDFLHKPVSQTTFLERLDHLTRPAAAGQPPAPR